jgi:hypothetical protein
MVEHTQFEPQDPNFDGYSQSRGLSRRRTYAFGRSAKTDYDESVPLFLSDPDGEPDPSEYDYPDFEAPRPRMSISLKILMAVIAAAGVAMMFAMATSDATRDIIVSAKASFISATPTPAAAAQPDVPPQISTQLTASDAQLKDTARWAAPGVIAPNASASSGVASNPPQTARGQVVAMAPTRDDISSAYQNAAQSRAPAVPPASSAAPSLPAPVATAPTVAAPPPARVIDAAELATLMKRAREMLSAGDIPVARLLLRRAADGQDPTAALLLAQTYDPDVLGTQDARNIIPDPEAARVWYQKAAQLGSADAQRRLAQMQ